MADLNSMKISKETWSLMKQEERDEAEAGALLFPDEPELWCPRCELGLDGCNHVTGRSAEREAIRYRHVTDRSAERRRRATYSNPIVYAIPHLTEKLDGIADVVRAIGEFSSGTAERDEAARAIQGWWALERERTAYGIDELRSHWREEDYEPWRYGCIGPYSENYSRCFGPCCN